MAISDPTKAAAVLQLYVTRWEMVADREPFRTHSSWLQPVRYRGIPAMLKIAFESEERWGGLLMAGWNGDGAASLADMARNGRDDAASRILCTVIGRLRAKGESLPQDFIPMSRWFEPLEPAASVHGGVLKRAVAIARELLDAPEDVVTLPVPASIRRRRSRRLGSRAVAEMDRRLGGVVGGLDTGKRRRRLGCCQFGTCRN